MVRKFKVRESKNLRRVRKHMKEGFAPTNSGEIYVKNLNANEIAKVLADGVNNLINGDYGTYWYVLGQDDENEYRIAVGDVDGYIEMKWAYVPNNSAMDDYEFDFIMPYDEDSGDVWDSSVIIREEGDTTPVTPEELLPDIKYMLDDFKRFVDEHNATDGDYYESVSHRTRPSRRRMSEARIGVNGRVSELSPQYDSRKSFYGKAHVVTDTDGTETLYSYNTPVVEIKDGKVKLLSMWDSSQTTLRHVREFLQQRGFSAGSKGEIARMYGESLKRSRARKESVVGKRISRKSSRVRIKEAYTNSKVYQLVDGETDEIINVFATELAAEEYAREYIKNLATEDDPVSVDCYLIDDESDLEYPYTVDEPQYLWTLDSVNGGFF